MSEVRTDLLSDESTRVDFDLKRRLEELARGDCSAKDFVREALDSRSDAESAWDLLATIDQRYRLGKIPDDLYQTIKSDISLRELRGVEFGTTVELNPVPRSATIKKDSAPPLTQIPALPAGSPAAPDITQPPQAGQVLCGRYTLASVIGSGGMSTVFSAIDRSGWLPAQAERRVAIKVLLERIDQRPGVLIQLRREFLCTQALSHPNIVKVYELDHDADLAFYTMELLEGERLSDLLGRVRPNPLPRRYAWEVIRAVGAAISHAHSRNVVHGDLKPQNVMITRKGEVRVLDFGSSRTCARNAVESVSDAPASPLTATPPYACCEILEGQQPDPRDDLYALACLAYELLSGRHVFEMRSSLEARAAGAIAPRPPRLWPRQWRALRTGLSWAREDRSVPIEEWLGHLGFRTQPQQLPPITTPYTPPMLSALSARWGRFALPATTFAFAMLVLFSFHRNPIPHSARPAGIARPTPAQARSMSATPAALLTPAKEPPRVPVEVISEIPAAAKPQTPVQPRRSTAADSISGPGRPSISLTARAYSARASSGFVEVRVRRSQTSRSPQGFTWWTENGTAESGDDYSAQPRITQMFSNGRQFASLFVRINPRVKRETQRIFFVNISDPDADSGKAAIRRASVILPASR